MYVCTSLASHGLFFLYFEPQPLIILNPHAFFMLCQINSIYI